jgi:DhnA family fructose-bisphosphate aldolase class Ia
LTFRSQGVVRTRLRQEARGTVAEDGVLLIAFDHAPLGLIAGLDRTNEIISGLLDDRVDGFVVSYGMAKFLAGPSARNPGAARAPLIVRLDGNQTYLQGDWTRSADWELFCSAETAMRVGAVGAIVNLLLGCPAELASIKVVSRAVAACAEVGLPLYVSAIACAEDTPGNGGADTDDRKVFAARMAFELGADTVSLYGSHDPHILKDASHWCHVPLIAQGVRPGSRVEDMAAWAGECRSSGAAGVCIGQAIWQSADPVGVARQVLLALRPGSGQRLGNGSPSSVTTDGGVVEPVSCRMG